MTQKTLTPQLIEVIRGRFALDWQGIHGAPHWARVRANGLRIATTTGANLRVVELFSFFHDSCRENDETDPEHGQRAAEFATQLNGDPFNLSQDELALLTDACRGHSEGMLEADITIQTCWDADRLDLGRVGIRPDPQRLCTPAARELIGWAHQRSTEPLRY